MARAPEDDTPWFMIAVVGLPLLLLIGFATWYFWPLHTREPLSCPQTAAAPTIYETGGNEVVVPERIDGRDTGTERTDDEIGNQLNDPSGEQPGRRASVP